MISEALIGHFINKVKRFSETNRWHKESIFKGVSKLYPSHNIKETV